MNFLVWTHAEIWLTHRICDSAAHDSRGLAAASENVCTCKVLALLAEIDDLRGTTRVVWILGSIPLQVVRAEDIWHSWLVWLELDLRAGHEVLELPLQVAHGLVSFNG